MTSSQMHDPLEGVTPAGAIVTGASLARVAPTFAAVLNAAIDLLRTREGASLYLYGSVATGMAAAPESDVDLLTIGLPIEEARTVSRALSERFRDRCRSVDVAVAQRHDFQGERDEAYGYRVFLRHYCVHLVGPDLHSALPDFSADRRAARGFNGDIARHVRRWRADLDEGFDPVQLSRRVGRKSLLAVAGLVSVHDRTWTTDRRRAAARWAEVQPGLERDLRSLVDWSEGRGGADARALASMLDRAVTEIADSFAANIGLWA